MIEIKTCRDFQNTGLLLLINQILHVFGWAIVIQIDGKKQTMHPARVKFRGFDSNSVTQSYVNISKYIKSECNNLLNEAEQ